MAYQMTNTKFTFAVLAAFALGGVSTYALGHYGSYGQNTPAQIAAQTEPAAGEKYEETNASAPVQNAASKVSADNPVIAKVNGKPITMDQVKEYVKTMPEQVAAAPIDQIFPHVQEQMVIGDIITEKASAEKLENDPEVLKRVDTLKENVIRATYLEREVNKRVNDAALKKQYDDFVKTFSPAEEVSAQHILVDSETAAKDIIAKLDKGAKFEDLVKEYSKDKGAKADGDLGYFKQGDMVKEFATAAFAMKKGEISKAPTKTQFGFHVIKINDRRTSKAPSFEEMEPQLKMKAQREAFEAIVADLRKNAKIELFDMKGNPVQAAAAKN